MHYLPTFLSNLLKRVSPVPNNHSLSYLITLSEAHIIPGQMLVQTLREKTSHDIIIVGNLSSIETIKRFEKLGVHYIDETSVNLQGRVPKFNWQEKYRALGWYKQMFLRLCADRYIKTEQVVVLDSEVFVFDNWDENRLYDKEGNPRCFYWISQQRKSEWDYKMYRGAAYILKDLPGFGNVMEYANSDQFRRHISGVVLFSTKNLYYMWDILTKKTDLEKNLQELFDIREDLAFCDHDLYGICVDYNLFNKVVKTTLFNGLLGWYDTHDDPHFNVFQEDAMWSMCQRYTNYPSCEQYKEYMQQRAQSLGKKLP